MNRNEHIAWCKNRALEYVDNGDTANALASMFNDLGKHDDTADHPAIELGTMLMFSGKLSSSDDVRKFIDGFN